MSISTETTKTELACPNCKKVFSRISNRNAHMRKIHQEEVEYKNKSRIFCPVCGEVQKSYENFYKHIEEKHNVNINIIVYKFSRKEEFENWKRLEKLETSYMSCRKIKKKKCSEMHYACNRSNTRGYQSNCKKRMEKSGGTIKIKGFCPSRIVVSLYENGQIVVHYQKTHLGHNENELRCQRLSNTEKNDIVEKLRLGIPTDKILEEVRRQGCNNPERINVLNKSHINYLKAKHINKKTRKEQMVAMALKVNEWKANGQNYAFIFKQEGEAHPILKKEDFVLGLMNPIMENKLRYYRNIICMDSTHCANNMKMGLTVLLIKDETNAGFPVAFFISNKLDQQIQEVFLTALKEKLGELRPNYLMTGDDNKYYHAWVKIMNNEPRRLLCTWHVMKNWNVQGKAKIRNLDMRKKMTVEMKNILNETDEGQFLNLVYAYCSKLEAASETDFLNYLNKNYFQPNRMGMWAHCYRKHAGFNINMSMESLNNFLRDNHLRRSTNITVEKLLDAIGQLVDVITWQQILSMKGPTADDYSDNSGFDYGMASDRESEPETEPQHQIDNRGENVENHVTRNAEIEDLGNFLKGLNREEYDNIMGKIKLLRKEVEDSKNNATKRKREKQLYYASKKMYN